MTPFVYCCPDILKRDLYAGRVQSLTMGIHSGKRLVACLKIGGDADGCKLGDGLAATGNRKAFAAPHTLKQCRKMRFGLKEADLCVHDNHHLVF